MCSNNNNNNNKISTYLITELKNNIVSQHLLKKIKKMCCFYHKVSIAFLKGLFKTFYCK